MISERAVFAFFPYLITRERVRIRGIEFRSNQDIADLPADIQEHVTTLSQMFFLEHGVRIEQMTCAYFQLPEGRDDQENMLRRLYEARLLVGYLYSHPHPSGGVFLPFENSALFVFQFGDLLQDGMVPTSFVWQGKQYGNRVKEVDAREIPSTDLTLGYYGRRDRTAHFCVAKGSRIFPETPHIVLNFSQELVVNLQMLLSHPYHWALYRFYIDQYDDLPDLRTRVFVALDWYMKSCRASIFEAEALVDLAIALESLLNVGSSEGVRDRLKDAILTLLGPVARLDLWVHQFYTARSDTVHEGLPTDLMFYPPGKELPKNTKNKKKEIPKNNKDDEAIPHRSLLAYGRRIFRLAVASILAGAMQARMNRLEALFITNAERIEGIRNSLSQQLSDDKRLLGIGQYVNELSDHTNDLMDPDVVDPNSVVWVVRLALQSYKAIPTITEPVKEVIEKLISSISGDPTVALLEQIEACAGQLSSPLKNAS
jgi:hypothetical protein